ncbi:MAG: guanine deaminase [Azospirillaceae bacterium]|nr:guanine deaminase [Azospirillaceae bacterium]
MLQTSAIRGRILSFTAEPAGYGDRSSYDYWADGLVRIEDGRIVAVGAADRLLPTLPPATPVDHYPDDLVLPGLIDCHIHLPQTQVVASYGTQLLEWLQRYTFVEEQKFADPGHAATVARFFLDELLRNGTTTAAIFGSVHPASVEALFSESERRGTAMIAGKVMMDRHAPPTLTDTATTAYDDSKALIERWHGRGRQRYAVTPRFAITSTEAQLEAAGALLRAYPGIHLQTHLAENHDEIATVRRLFPDDASYTAVYQRFGLLSPRSLLGHCIHLAEDELRLLADSDAVAVFCPTSNLFMGSGLFDHARINDPGRPIRIALATDIGGGTSYSLLRTAGEGYKVQQLQGRSWTALSAFHQMTRGNARALGLDDEIGTVSTGRYGDLVVLDARSTAAMAHRLDASEGELDEELFVLMTLGDDRAVRATYVQGRCAHRRA